MTHRLTCESRTPLGSALSRRPASPTCSRCAYVFRLGRRRLEHVRVTNVGEAVDDIIGPMVNKLVIVEVDVNARGGRKFVDIEPDD